MNNEELSIAEIHLLEAAHVNKVSVSVAEMIDTVRQKYGGGPLDLMRLTNHLGKTGYLRIRPDSNQMARLVELTDKGTHVVFLHQQQLVQTASADSRPEPSAPNTTTVNISGGTFHNSSVMGSNTVTENTFAQYAPPLDELRALLEQKPVEDQPLL